MIYSWDRLTSGDGFRFGNHLIETEMFLNPFKTQQKWAKIFHTTCLAVGAGLPVSRHLTRSSNGHPADGAGLKLLVSVAKLTDDVALPTLGYKRIGVKDQYMRIVKHAEKDGTKE